MDLDVVLLRSFAQVMARGTVAAAADALGYTAPAVSQHLGRLERRLGAPLFDRVGGRLRPTELARRLLPRALDVLEAHERCAAVSAPPGPVPVTVAGVASALTELVVPALAPLRATHAVTVIEAEDDDALRDLGLGQADVALVQQYDLAPVTLPGRFVYTPVVRDRLRLVLPRRRSRGTTLADLADAPWLLNGSGTRCADAVGRLLARAGITPTVAASVADNRALLALVAAGHGVAVVPELVLGRDARGVTVADQVLRAHRTVLAAVRRGTQSALRPVTSALAAAAAAAAPRSAG